MRSPDRIPIILETIAKIWALHPDLRLGQLLGTAIKRLAEDTATPRTQASFFYVEDDLLLAQLAAEFLPNEPPPLVTVFDPKTRPKPPGAYRPPGRPVQPHSPPMKAQVSPPPLPMEALMASLPQGHVDLRSTLMSMPIVDPSATSLPPKYETAPKSEAPPSRLSQRFTSFIRGGGG